MNLTPKPKLTPQTCTARPAPLCPYCGCKNESAVGYMDNRRSAKDLGMICLCCKNPFKFNREVSVVFTSRPKEGWPS